MPDIKTRSTQTKVKHTILKNYFKTWGGIIINGWRRNSNTLHLVYVDCNASFGRYDGELEDKVARRERKPVFGSPIIGVQTLDELAAFATDNAHIKIRTNTILFEQERSIFDELKRSLEMAKLAQRVRETEDFFSLKDGEIAVLHKDSTLMTRKLINYTQSGYTFSFFSLDPYGPKGIPLSFVGEIVRQQRHDVIINVPYYDLHKKTGIVPKQSQLSSDEKLLQNYDDMFGNKEWQHIVKGLDTDPMREGQEALLQETKDSDTSLSEKAIEAGNLELELMNCYKKSLLSVDPGLTVKSIGLNFPDRERRIYYLYLTTHDPTGALKMNEVLWEAGFQEHELRWELMELKKHGPQTPLPLFEYEAPVPQTPQRKTTEEIAKHIHVLFRGKSKTKKDIYSALADETYFNGEVDKALTYLKRKNLASFERDNGINTLFKISK
jgi:three-Cys-motif partner protein